MTDREQSLYHRIMRVYVSSDGSDGSLHVEDVADKRAVEAEATILAANWPPSDDQCAASLRELGVTSDNAIDDFVFDIEALEGGVAK